MMCRAAAFAYGKAVFNGFCYIVFGIFYRFGNAKAFGKVCGYCR